MLTTFGGLDESDRFPSIPLLPTPAAAWDMAGAFTLLGCAAAILGEIEPIIETSARRGAGAK
jgi:hypothetical protein